MREMYEIYFKMLSDPNLKYQILLLYCLQKKDLVFHFY